MWIRKKADSGQKRQGQDPYANEIDSGHDVYLKHSLSSNIKLITKYVGKDSDIVFRFLKLLDGQQTAALVYIDNLADNDAIQQHIITPVLREFGRSKGALPYPVRIDRIKDSVITVRCVSETDRINYCIFEVFKGNTVFFLDGSNRALVLTTPGWTTRNQEEPIAEPSVRGPRDSFVETLQENIIRIRRRIRDSNLTLKKYKIGRRTKTDVAVMYLRGVVNQNIVDELDRRLSRIDIDAIMASGYIEQFIEDNILTVFPQTQYSERPDKTAAAILDGRIAILVDNTPFVLIVPAVFAMLVQAPDDYYDRWVYSSFIRSIRYIAIAISLFLPAFYVSLISFHQGLIPTRLVIFAAATREGIPFPALIEALLMEITLEILREAGVRLPKSIGQAVGIVGGLVIGEAATNAGIVSPVMVIIVALTAVSSFSVPQYTIGISMRILRFLIIFAAGVFGLYGVMLSFMMIIANLAKLKSFGIDYMSPQAPLRLRDMKDFFLRLPMTAMKKRPKALKVGDERRQRDDA
jgi:spore germination protein